MEVHDKVTQFNSRQEFVCARYDHHLFHPFLQAQKSPYQRNIPWITLSKIAASPPYFLFLHFNKYLWKLEGTLEIILFILYLKKLMLRELKCNLTWRNQDSIKIKISHLLIYCSLHYNILHPNLVDQVCDKTLLLNLIHEYCL